MEDLSEVEDYLRFVGRLHDVAGVDPRFLDVTGLAFCHALDQLDQRSLHGDIWNSQVKDTWQTFFRVIVRAMKKGYANFGNIAKNNLILFSEQKSLITEVSPLKILKIYNNNPKTGSKALNISLPIT